MRSLLMGLFALALTACGGGFSPSSDATLALSSTSNSSSSVNPICVPGSLQTCQDENGYGMQTCNAAGTAWGACGGFVGCISGYNLQMGACVVDVCNPNFSRSCVTGNGTGIQSCNTTGSAWGVCGNLTSCNAGYNLQGGACAIRMRHSPAQRAMVRAHKPVTHRAQPGARAETSRAATRATICKMDLAQPMCAARTRFKAALTMAATDCRRARAMVRRGASVGHPRP